MILQLLFTFNFFIIDSIFEQSLLSFSTKSTNSAPLEIASIPSDPVPANMSKQIFLFKSFSNQLKSVSLVLFSVGRNSLLGLKGIFVPLKVPAIIFVVACLLLI